MDECLPEKYKNLGAHKSFPNSVKSVEEPKRRIIFTRLKGISINPITVCQDILHAINMKLLGMKVPPHLRPTKLRHNEKGNSTGPISSQTTVEAMVTLFGEELTQTALRFDPPIQDVAANQQRISLKAHGVERGRYYPVGGLNQIKEEMAAGPSALELPFTPR